MKRRHFMRWLAGVACAWPPAAVGDSDPMRLIGVLWGGFTPSTPVATSVVATYVNGLRNLGWVENQNVRLEHRWVAEQASQINASAAELVYLRPEVVVVNSSPLLAAVMRQTRTIPVVFVRVADPVGQSFIPSLARPGSNVTGFTD